MLTESRKEWMYWMMQRAGKKNNNNTDFQFWQQHNHPIELDSNELKHTIWLVDSIKVHIFLS